MKVLRPLLACVMISYGPLQAAAQDGPVRTTHIVEAAGLRTRVVTWGLEDRHGDEPVILLMAGATLPIEAWGNWPKSVAALSPVITYDRPGAGETEYDGRSLTPADVADHAEAVLAELDVEGPFVLVGHSWGGVLILKLSARIAEEVVGMVYLDPAPPWQSGLINFAAASEEDLDRRIDDVRRLLVGLELPPALLEEQFEVLNFYHLDPDKRSLPPDPPVPSALVLAGQRAVQYEAPDGSPEWLDDQVEFLARIRGIQADAVQWFLRVPNSRILISTDSGHMVFEDAADLALVAVRWVIDAAKDGEPGPGLR